MHKEISMKRKRRIQATKLIAFKTDNSWRRKKKTS